VIADVDLGVNNVRLVKNTLDVLSNTSSSKCFGDAGERKERREGGRGSGEKGGEGSESGEGRKD
jgi:hypothetical protein